MIACPLCAVEMSRYDVNGVDVDECAQCEGLWFDALELTMLDQPRRRGGEILQRLLAVKRKDDRRSEPLKCPKCKINIQRRQHSIQSGVDIDECYACGGIWLDAGELAAIRNNCRTDAERDRLVLEMLEQAAKAEHPHEKDGRPSLIRRIMRLFA